MNVLHDHRWFDKRVIQRRAIQMSVVLMAAASAHAGEPAGNVTDRYIGKWMRVEFTSQERSSGESSSRSRSKGLGKRQVKIAVLTGLSADSLWMTANSSSGFERFSVARSQVSHLAVSIGKRSNAGKGALIGLGAGFVLGAVAGYQAGPPCLFSSFGGGCEPPTSSERRQFALVAGALVGAGGALMGAMIGEMSKTQKWQTIEVKNLTLHVMPVQQTGPGLMVSLKF